MTCNAIIITTPNINFDQFLSAASLVFGRNLSEKTDKVPGVSVMERLASCLGQILNVDSPRGVHAEFLNHLYYSVFLVCPVDDLMAILSICEGMPFVAGEAVNGHAGAFVTGGLMDWRQAITSGTSLRQTDGCRECFCRLMERFESIGLGKLWDGRSKKWDAERLFYLKHEH
jgi:hypothetical protein